MDRRLSPGKVRRLQAASSPAGVFRILAVDHRGVLLKMMDPDGDGRVPADRVTRLKLDVVGRLAPLATAVILDPQYGALQAIASGAIPGGVGLLVPLDGGPRAGGPSTSEERPPSWSVRQASLAGAVGVKLYLSYHPDAGARSSAQEDLVRDIVLRCDEEAMPLYLEPVPCSIDPEAPVGSSRFARDRRRIAIETAARLGALGPDVLKLPFPVDGRHEPDEAVWRSACAELSEASPVPWALLSAGDPFDMFGAQLQVACESGCSGFMAGRSVWAEAATAGEGERGALLEQTVRPRLRELNRIADRYGRGWHGRR
jgi:tagatose-1,6-bisphosphate aldolase